MAVFAGTSALRVERSLGVFAAAAGSVAPMPIVNPTNAMTDSPLSNLCIFPTSCCQSLSGSNGAAETLYLLISKHFLPENGFALLLEMRSAT
ncbi:MAG: hypothetical protein AAAB36_25715, partial [Ensifer adhaerens]